MIKYKKYKPSGIDWIGEIPEHWEVKRAKEILNVFIPQRDKPNLADEGYPWVTMEYLNGGILDNNKIRFFVSKNELLEKKIRLVPANSVLASCVGDFSITSINKIPIVINQQIQAFTNFKKIDISLFNFTIQSKKYKEYYNSIASETTLKYLNKDKFLFTPIIYPPLSEQKIIATYLDTKTYAVDCKITVLEQKTNCYQQLRKSLINETVCRGLNKNVKLKDSRIEWIGKIPEHWDVKRFKCFAQTIKGKNLEFSDVYFEKSLPNLSLEYLRNDEVMFQTYCYSSSKSMRVSEEDYIIIWDGAGVGEILKGKKGFLSSTIAKIVVNPKLAYPQYFFHLRNSIEYTLKQIPTGMGIPHLNPVVLNNFPCPCPPVSEQIQISTFLDEKTQKIDSILSNIKTQIETLKELRKTLINDVVTGKIKVS